MVSMAQGFPVALERIFNILRDLGSRVPLHHLRRFVGCPAKEDHLMDIMWIAILVDMTIYGLLGFAIVRIWASICLRPGTESLSSFQLCWCSGRS